MHGHPVRELLVITSLHRPIGSHDVSPGDATTGDWSSRLAGAVVLLVGALNLVVAVLSFATGLVRISAGAAGGFVAVGLALLAVGALIWRANRAATIGAFAVFVALLLLQIGRALTDPAASDAALAAASGDQVAGRLVVLTLLALTCGTAAWRHRRASRRRATG
jgi:hypothetical protein